MAGTEKLSLINELTLAFAEKFDVNFRDVKVLVTDTLKNYHVTISDENIKNEDFSTEYLMKKFCDGKKAINIKDKTLLQYKIAVQLLEKYTGKQLSDNEPEDITNFMRSYGYEVKSVTLRAKYNLLSSVYNWLYNRKYIPSNPIIAVDPPKVEKTYKNAMTDVDLEKLKFVCENMDKVESARDMAIMSFLTSTGCRVSEMCGVKLGDIDFENETCKVLGKGRKERPVVLTKAALFRINEYLKFRKDTSASAPLFACVRGKEKALSVSGIQKMIKKIRKTANLTEITCHTFRRYNATLLRRHNVPIQMIADNLGHANDNQINHYSRFDNKEKLDKIRYALC